MIRGFLSFLCLIAGACADPVTDQLRQPQLQEIFKQLQTKSLSASKLTDEELNRAAVQGLLQRLGTGAALVPAAASPPTGKLVSELLLHSIAYLRPASLTVAEIASLDAALEGLAASKAETLILDLRAPTSPGEPMAATEFLSRFLPDATPLFQVRTAGAEATRAFVSKGEPRWQKPLLILMDTDTGNVGEIIAAVLQQKLSAWLIGSPTIGHACEYRISPVTPEWNLRIAESETLLGGDRKLFGVGLTPDIRADFESSKKLLQFTESEKSGMKRYAYEVERPRMNEAALVAQTNPELDYQIARSAHETTEFDRPAAIDPVLQQAVDFLTAQAFLKESPSK